jgi:hypothetical protein
MILRPALLFLTILSVVSAVEPRFEPQVIDPAIGIGYGLAVGDVDGDGKADVLLADAKEIVWYQNPIWKKHALTGSLTKRDHVCIAARDVDGDGKVEVAVGAQWNPGETTNAAESGAVFYLQRPRDGGPGLWTAVPLPHEPTVHRMHWVRDGRGKAHLIVVPLHGRGNKNGAGAGVKIQDFAFPGQPADAAAWVPKVLSDELHITHNFDYQTEGGGERLVIGGKEGFLDAVPEADGWTASVRQLTDAPGTLPAFAGIGEIRFFPATQAEAGGSGLAAIEPFHGPNLAVYQKDPATRQWMRTVVDSTMNQGHALACGDLLGMAAPQIVAGWREPNAEGRFGIRIHWQEKPVQPWQQAWVASGNSMACEDLKLADLDRDGRLDIIASGRSTKNVVIYWNRTPVP